MSNVVVYWPRQSILNYFDNIDEFQRGKKQG